MVIAWLAPRVWVPALDAGGEFGFDLGLDADLRGVIAVGLDLQLVAGGGPNERWHLDVYTRAETTVRSNRADESPVRISPEHIGYPVGARLRFELAPDREWGPFIFHRSEHDIDLDEASLNRETLAYETYGVDLRLRSEERRGRVALAMVYDRGTRLDGTRQKRPFEYSFGALEAGGTTGLWGPSYASGWIFALGRVASPWADISGHLEVGARKRGIEGDARLFLRLARFANYQHLEDPARHLLLLGIGLGDDLVTGP